VKLTKVKECCCICRSSRSSSPIWSWRASGRSGVLLLGLGMTVCSTRRPPPPHPCTPCGDLICLDPFVTALTMDVWQYTPRTFDCLRAFPIVSTLTLAVRVSGWDEWRVRELEELDLSRIAPHPGGLHPPRRGGSLGQLPPLLPNIMDFHCTELSHLLTDLFTHFPLIRSLHLSFKRMVGHF